MKFVEKYVHGGNIYSKSPTGEWLDFSANINPLGISGSVRQCLTDNISGLVNYPDPSGLLPRKAIAEYYDLPLDSIVLGNGAVELLYVFFHARKPQNVLLPVPSFSEYERAAVAGNAEIVYYQLSEAADFRLDIDRFIQKLAFIDCAIIGNPNNPTGGIITTDGIEKIVVAAQKTGTMIIVDESFNDFLDDGIRFSARSLIGRYDNLLVLQSLTKFYALPGLRLGFAAVPDNLTSVMEAQKDPWNMNSLAQAAIPAALADKAYQEKSRQLIKSEQEYLVSMLSKIDTIKIFPPTVNFILLDVKKCGLTAKDLTSKLREMGILVRNCDNYSGLTGEYIRIAVKDHEKNVKLIAAIKELLL